MGRVRKYKKIKAVDPASKQRAYTADTTRDEPPEMYHDRVKKSLAKMNDAWGDDDKRERMIQNEARRVEKLEAKQKAKARVNTVEGKRDDENMKAFKERIRLETKATLIAANSKTSATAKKKKAYLTEKKLEKKTGIKRRKGVNEEDEEEEGFSHRGDGYLRASDRGGSDSFTAHDDVRFGERYEKPPEISFGLTAKQKAKIADKKKNNDLLLANKLAYGAGKSSETAGEASSDKNKNSSKLSERDLDIAREEARAAYKIIQQKRKADDLKQRRSTQN
jgi:hypothetical protein